MPRYFEALCQHCGASFTAQVSGERGGQGRFCSLSCSAAHRDTRVERKCLRCGAGFLAARANPKKYCSRGCYNAARGCEGPGVVEAECEYCGRHFQVGARKRRRGFGRFCSLACKNMAQRIPGSMVVVRCAWCGVEFTAPRSSRRKYCSGGCMYASRVEKVERRCDWCGVEFAVVPAQADRRFCSRSCFDRSRERPSRGSRWRARYRRWRQAVIEKYDGLCGACGEIAVSPQVHHVLGWEAYPGLRYEPANGVLMCGRCHVRYADGVAASR